VVLTGDVLFEKEKAIDKQSPDRYICADRWNCRGGKMMKFKPLGARALVKEVEREQTTESGIVLPDTAKEKPQSAEVVAVGAHEDVKVGVGDVVVVRKYSGTEVKLDGQEHRIVDAEDILGVVEG
jgi:chaperonin GroES